MTVSLGCGVGLRGSGAGQQLAGIEPVSLEDRAAAGVEPVGARAVVVELDAVAVRVGEVDRDGAAVVGGVVDRWPWSSSRRTAPASSRRSGYTKATW